MLLAPCVLLWGACPVSTGKVLGPHRGPPNKRHPAVMYPYPRAHGVFDDAIVVEFVLSMPGDVYYRVNNSSGALLEMDYIKGIAAREVKNITVRGLVGGELYDVRLSVTDEGRAVTRKKYMSQTKAGKDSAAVVRSPPPPIVSPPPPDQGGGDGVSPPSRPPIAPPIPVVVKYGDVSLPLKEARAHTADDQRPPPPPDAPITDPIIAMQAASATAVMWNSTRNTVCVLQELDGPRNALLTLTFESLVICTINSEVYSEFLKQPFGCDRAAWAKWIVQDGHVIRQNPVVQAVILGTAATTATDQLTVLPPKGHPCRRGGSACVGRCFAMTDVHMLSGDIFVHITSRVGPRDTPASRRSPSMVSAGPDQKFAPVASVMPVRRLAHGHGLARGATAMGRIIVIAVFLVPMMYYGVMQRRRARIKDIRETI